MNLYQQKLFKIYLHLIQFYYLVRKLCINFIGPIKILYYIDGQKIINITWNYYSGHHLINYDFGNYFCKILQNDHTDYITHYGKLFDLHKYIVPNISPNYPMPKRKNIILLDCGAVIHFDLNILDNYVRNMSQLGKIDDLGIYWFLKCLGINCTHIQIFHMKPFKKEVLPLEQLVINNIYESY